MYTCELVKEQILNIKTTIKGQKWLLVKQSSRFVLGGELYHFVVVAYLLVIPSHTSSACGVSGIALVLNSVNRVIEKKEMPPGLVGVYTSELRGQNEYKLQGLISKSPPLWTHIRLCSVLFTLDTEIQCNHGQRLGKQVQRPNSTH